MSRTNGRIGCDNIEGLRSWLLSRANQVRLGETEEVLVLLRDWLEGPPGTRAHQDTSLIAPDSIVKADALIFQAGDLLRKGGSAPAIAHLLEAAQVLETQTPQTAGGG